MSEAFLQLGGNQSSGIAPSPIRLSSSRSRRRSSNLKSSRRSARGLAPINQAPSSPSPSGSDTARASAPDQTVPQSGSSSTRLPQILRRKKAHLLTLSRLKASTKPKGIKRSPALLKLVSLFSEIPRFPFEQAAILKKTQIPFHQQGQRRSGRFRRQNRGRFLTYFV